MSGDVQPRKRKDKKRKKDELSAGSEEIHTPGPGTAGTAAIFGEGDVFLHTHHDHGTGGHWCAKVIFFSLLAVLITLIGLIILENRGLSELEANAVESRYAGVLEGWLEDSPDDDHHDEHTLELKHHDEEEESEELQPAYQNGDHEDDEDHGGDDDEQQGLDDAENEDEQDQLSEEDENDLEDENNASEDENDEEDDLKQNYAEDEQEDENNDQEEENEDQEERNDDHDDDYDRQENDEEQENDNSEENDVDEQGNEDDEEAYQSNEVGENEDSENTFEKADQENEDDEHEDDDHDEEDEDEEETEVEHIEQEPDEEPISLELPALAEQDDDDDDDDQRKTEADDLSAEQDDRASVEDEDEEFLEQDEIDNEPPVVERITAPAGKPFQEVDEEDSSERPVDTLADEEEYERRQEELRREEAEASHVWLKLGVGGALLLATHAVLRRAVAPRDTPANGEETDQTETVREDTPVSGRMNVIAEEPSPPATPRFVPPPPQKRVITEEMMMMTKPIPSITQSAPTPKQVSLEDEEIIDEEEIEEEEVTRPKTASPAPKEELYSDEEIEEEEEEEEVIVPKKAEPTQSSFAPKKEEPKPKEATPELEPEDDEEVADDVEIIEDEDLEEELEEEEISDVDDAELLTRLEAKYGRLPEPERPAGYHPPKDGGNSVDSDWPGEPSDSYWRSELDGAERDLRQGAWEAAEKRAASPQLASSARARYVVAKSLDELAEARRDNRLLGRSIAAYLELLKMNEKLPDEKLLDVAARTMNRMHFRGTYLSAEPVHRLLIRRFPDEPAYRNNLTITYLMANRADLAADVLNETLARWPKDRVALAHFAFVLKTHYNRLEEAVDLFQKALKGDIGPANEPRFYFHLGDSLLLLGRYEEAQEVHKRAAKLGHFLSPAQRSLYNVNRLKSKPWWNVEETPYARLARALEKSWKAILKEGQAAKASYEAEKEGLRESGDWSQLDLFARGREIPDRCSRAPVTCSIVQAEPAATGCRRGQVKFSSMEPGTHVRPHVGPTNCRLRMHLALSNTEGTYLRVDKETRQWQVGKVLLFDDSFEHEVWHNGSATRLVLIVDVWHPDLTSAERLTLPAI